MDYHKILSKDIKALQLIVSKEQMIVGQDINEDYSHDELGNISEFPEILIKVNSTEEVSKIMAYANQHNIPVVVRGSGTGLVGASVALHRGIMLDMTNMNHILELDEENLMVTVEAGVLLMDLAEFVENHGFLYPPDPGEKTATIGGNISTNAGGMRAVKYGVTRDYVMGLTVVLPSGEILELGGKIVKNSSGFNLIHLIAGSEGTLGVITRATLKLIPLPSKSISLLIPFPTIEQAITVIPEIIKTKSEPTAIEFMEKDTILFSEEYLGKKFPDTSSDAYVLLTFDGNSVEQIEKEYDKVAKLCLNKGAADVFLVDTEERKESVWNARGAFLEAIKASTSELDECDVVVPRNRIADFIKYTHQIAKKLDIRIPSFGHAGDGNLHVYICRDQLEQKIWENKLTETFQLMYNCAAEYGGQVSGEHGIGIAKKNYLHDRIGKSQVMIMKSIKLVFDPNMILNPGKVV